MNSVFLTLSCVVCSFVLHMCIHHRCTFIMFMHISLMICVDYVIGAGALALPVLWKFFELFPDPNSVLTGNPLDIANLMQPLGLNNKRASIICRLSST